MKILVVDDLEQNVYQLQVLLQGNGYTVDTATNGAGALEKARSSPPDLIITDILMPVMDGFSLCREWMLDEDLKDIPLILYTATYTDERDRKLALDLGAARFIVKPEEPEVFLQTIRDVIQQAASTPPMPPRAPGSQPTAVPQEEETVYLKQYNEALVRKLEAKMLQLDQANRELQLDVVERRRAGDLLRQQADELRARNHELTLFNRLVVGRELRMVELKQEVNELCRRLGEPPRHALSPPPGGGAA